MANQIYIPKLNPVRFYGYPHTQLPQYESRHMEDYSFADQLMSWQTRVEYRQKWTVNDTLRLQMHSNFGNIQIQIIDCHENVYLTQSFTQVLQNSKIPDYFVYETAISFSGITPGVYFFLLTLGGVTKMVSEPQQVYSTLPESLLFEYKNSKWHGDIIFETGFSPSFRIPAILLPELPGKERTSYVDQKWNPSTLKSISHRSYNLVVEKDRGGAAWIADLMDRIFSCDSVFIDGRSYAVFDANFEAAEADAQYPMKAYSIKVMEGINRASKIVNAEIDTNKRLLITHVLDATIFGNLNATPNTNLITIESIE
jgi:hypothetical protein